MSVRVPSLNTYLYAFFTAIMHRKDSWGHQWCSQLATIGVLYGAWPKHGRSCGIHVDGSWEEEEEEDTRRRRRRRRSP